MNKTSCPTCLSLNRKLKPLKPQVQHLFAMLCPDMCFKTINRYRICWECEFMIDKIKLFQDKVRKADNILKLYLKGKATITNQLSSLKRTEIETISIPPLYSPRIPQNTPTLPQFTPTLPQFTPTLPQITPTLSQYTSSTSLKDMLSTPLKLDIQDMVKIEEESDDRRVDGDYDDLIQPTTIQYVSNIDPLQIPDKPDIEKKWIEVPSEKPVKKAPTVISRFPKKTVTNAPIEQIALRGVPEPVKVTSSSSNVVTAKENILNVAQETAPIIVKDQICELNLERLLTKLLTTPSTREKFQIKQSDTSESLPENQRAGTELSTSERASEDEAKCIILSRAELDAVREKRRSYAVYMNSTFKCEKCIEWYQSQEKLDEHNIKHDLSQGSSVCEICELRFPHDSVRNEHYNQHFLAYKCLQCQYQHSSRLKMSEHIRKNHEESSFYCQKCNTYFKTYKERRRHIILLHTKKIKCEECGIPVAKGGMNTHIGKVHKREMAQCVLCKKKVRKCNLKLHMKVHDGNRQYVAHCADCGTSYKTKHAYENHLKNSLKHNTIETVGVKCEHCDTYFRSKAALKSHVETMFGVKYTCDICNKSCKSKKTLSSHIKILHEGVKPKHKQRICEICGKSFTNKKSIEEHINSHLGRRPLVCKDCGATFVYSAALFTHRRLVHKVKRKYEMTSEISNQFTIVD